jgi:hypothetical protein
VAHFLELDHPLFELLHERLLRHACRARLILFAARVILQGFRSLRQILTELLRRAATVIGLLRLLFRSAGSDFRVAARHFNLQPLCDKRVLHFVDGTSGLFAVVRVLAARCPAGSVSVLFAAEIAAVLVAGEIAAMQPGCALILRATVLFNRLVGIAADARHDGVAGEVRCVHELAADACVVRIDVAPHQMAAPPPTVFAFPSVFAGRAPGWRPARALHFLRRGERRQL